jgi:hypothetical protein
MGDTVHPDRMQSRIASKDLQHAPGSRVSVKYRLDIFSYRPEHIFLSGVRLRRMVVNVYIDYTPFTQGKRDWQASLLLTKTVNIISLSTKIASVNFEVCPLIV